MSDFYQTGVVTTLHRLKPNNLERLEGDLERFSKSRPIGLVLPALYSEFETPSMQHIVTELRKVRYLQRIVVAVGRATREQFDRARSFFKDFYTPVTFMWVDGERIQSLLKMLEEKALSAGTDGKGRSCWLAYGALLAHASATSSPCTIATSSTTTGSCWRGSATRSRILTWDLSSARATTPGSPTACTDA